MRFTTPSSRHSMLRRCAVGAAVATASLVGTLGATAAAAPPAPLQRPAAVPGDPHSPAVILHAGVALTAHDTFMWNQTPDTFVAYLNERNATADAVAFELGIDAIALRDAWARADLEHQEAVLAALTQIGAQYVSNTSDPAVGFDCSGLTAFAWGRAGVSITRQSSSQIDAARSIDQSAAVAGDLAQYPGHVMMYLGTGEAIVHAANQSTDVALSFIRRDVRFGDPTG